jgi:hypothetical protein
MTDEYDPLLDFYLSYYACVDELRRRYLAGEPLPDEWNPALAKAKRNKPPSENDR